MMHPVVARYIEDRSVDVRLERRGKVTVCLDGGLVLRAMTKKDVSWHTCS